MILDGSRFGKLTVKGPAGRDQGGHQLYLCACDCGAKRKCLGYNLLGGKTKSCGCFKRDVTRKRMTIHGLYGTPENRCWNAMKSRCYNRKHVGWKYYGERGIAVCDRWMNSFENFLADMGPRPGPEFSIDRINNSGNYEPGNCRWATKTEQVKNQRPKRRRTP